MRSEPDLKNEHETAQVKKNIYKTFPEMTSEKIC
jgi:hypothetical protein